jgi:hypothetical protein
MRALSLVKSRVALETRIPLPVFRPCLEDASDRIDLTDLITYIARRNHAVEARIENYLRRELCVGSILDYSFHEALDAKKIKCCKEHPRDDVSTPRDIKELYRLSRLPGYDFYQIASFGGGSWYRFFAKPADTSTFFTLGDADEYFKDRIDDAVNCTGNAGHLCRS